ncbi:MAG TPA: 50S ribosomal protein L25 [Candidatus Saccharimonadia bacterium]|nr:50S ribosomal protein L25 [Candidatus Saccharimonadia bacterium]
MSSEEILLELQKREVLGKGLVKLRKEGLVPAIIHDHGKPSKAVMGDYLKIVKVFTLAGKHHPVILDVSGAKETVIIKDVHIDPVKNTIQHVVFQAIRQDETVETEVPIIMVGDSPAQKVGLLLITHLSVVNVEALPKDLPDELKVDISNLVEIGDKVTVADLVIPEKVTLLTESEALIASIEETKAQISEETLEEEETVEAEAGSEEAETEEQPAEE